MACSMCGSFHLSSVAAAEIPTWYLVDSLPGLAECGVRREPGARHPVVNLTTSPRSLPKRPSVKRLSLVTVSMPLDAAA